MHYRPDEIKIRGHPQGQTPERVSDPSIHKEGSRSEKDYWNQLLNPEEGVSSGQVHSTRVLRDCKKTSPRVVILIEVRNGYENSFNRSHISCNSCPW